MPLWANLAKTLWGPEVCVAPGLGARNQEKPMGGGPERCGAQNLKGGARGVESPKVGGGRGVGSPTFRAFFPSSAPFFPFFSLSGGLLVEFWWCLKRRDPQMCTFGVLGLSCETLAALVTMMMIMSRYD